MSADLLALSATEALAAFRDRTLSPVELMRAVLAHGERLGPQASGLLATHPEEALRAARAAETRWLGRGEPARPLEGVPVALSDDLEVAGEPLTESSLLLVDHVSPDTEPLVARLLAAGAIMHARTRTAEFISAPVMRSRLYGDTPNPWNPRFDAGAPAGGAGAALATGATMLAGGVDMLGMTPVAASACGVVALKPAYGRIPLVYPFALDTCAHYAPMARTVADVALLFDQLAGPDDADPATLPAAGPVGAPDLGIDGLRVAISEDLGGYEVHSAVRRDLREAGRALSEAGASVAEVDLRIDPGEVAVTLRVHTGHTVLPMMGRHMARIDEMTPHTAAVLERVRAAAQEAPLTEAAASEMRLYARLAGVFAAHDALVCPALAVPALTREPPAGDISGVLTAAVFVLCGRHPFVCLPSGPGDGGVPSGMVVVARRHDERTALRVAAAYERFAGRRALAPGGGTTEDGE